MLKNILANIHVYGGSDGEKSTLSAAASGNKWIAKGRSSPRVSTPNKPTGATTWIKRANTIIHV